MITELEGAVTGTNAQVASGMSLFVTAKILLVKKLQSLLVGN